MSMQILPLKKHVFSAQKLQWSRMTATKIQSSSDEMDLKTNHQPRALNTVQFKNQLNLIYIIHIIFGDNTACMYMYLLLVLHATYMYVN